MSFRNVQVYSASSPVEIGGMCIVSCSYEHMGEATQEVLYAAIGNDGLWGFDEILSATSTRTISAHSSWTKIWGSVIINVTAAIDPNDSPYDVYCKIGGVVSESVRDVVVISGGTPPPPEERFQNLIITNYATPVQVGGSCQVRVSFLYQGPAQTVQLYAALGNNGWAGFDEIVAGQANLTLPETSVSTAMTATVNIPVTSAVNPNQSPYDLYAKISGKINSPAYENIVTVTGGTTNPDFRNLRVMNASTPVEIGGVCQVDVAFEYQGPAASVVLYAALGNDGALGFNEILHGQTTISVPASSSLATFTRSVNITITTEIDPDDSPYDVYAKFVGGQVSPTVYNVVYVAPDEPPAAAFRNYRILSYTTPVGPGEQCTVRVGWEYQGPAKTVEVYTAIGNDGIWGFNEILAGSDWANIPKTMQWTEYFKDVVINIIAGLSEGDSPYDMYAKVDGKISPILQNVLHVRASAGEPQFRALQIIDYDSPVRIGGVCRIKVEFEYQGPAVTKTLHLAIGNNGTFGFDEIVNKEVSLNVTAADTWTRREYITTLQISGLSVDDSPYDLYAKLNGTLPDIEAPVLNNVLGIEGGDPGTGDIVGVLTSAKPLTFDAGSEVNINVSYSAYTDDAETQLDWTTRVVVSAGTLHGQTASEHVGPETEEEVEVVAGVMPETPQTGTISLLAKKAGGTEWAAISEVPVTINPTGSGEPSSGSGWIWGLAAGLFAIAIAGGGSSPAKKKSVKRPPIKREQ
jgi:hypothetical protein